MEVNLPFCPRVFDPTAEDLIGHHLKNHILQRHYPESAAIQDATVFGENLNPWEKFCNPYDPYPWQPDTNSTPTLFLFTKLSNIGSTSKSNNVQKKRAAGCGTWHGNSKLIEVHSLANENLVIGHSRVLSFRSNNGEETVGQWTMYEYSIRPQAFPELRGSDWEDRVICRIKRDDSKSSIGGKVTKKIKGSRKSIKNSPAEPVSIKGNVEEEVVNVTPPAVLDDEHQGGVAAAEAVNEMAAQQPSQVDCSTGGMPSQVDCSTGGTYYGQWTDLDDPGLEIDMDELLAAIGCD